MSEKQPPPDYGLAQGGVITRHGVGSELCFLKRERRVGAPTVQTVTRKNIMLATAAIDSFVAAQPYEADLAPELEFVPSCAAESTLE